MLTDGGSDLLGIRESSISFLKFAFVIGKSGLFFLYTNTSVEKLLTKKRGEAYCCSFTHTATNVCFFSIGREPQSLSIQQTEELEESRSFRHGIAETSEN